MKKENLAATLKLVGEVLREPAFPDAGIRRSSRTKSSKGLRPPRPTRSTLALNALERKLNHYPKDNVRYVPTFEESIDILKGTKLADVKSVLRQAQSAQAGELVAVGDFDAKAVTRRTDDQL